MPFQSLVLIACFDAVVEEGVLVDIFPVEEEEEVFASAYRTEPLVPAKKTRQEEEEEVVDLDIAMILS